MISSKILIIDDDECNLKLLEIFLKDGGYSNFKSISDSRMAIKTFQEFEPDLILLDLQMPYINGFQVLKSIREIPSGKNVLIMMVTSKNSPQARSEAFQLGADDFVLKPMEGEGFVQQIDNLIKRNCLEH